MDGLKPWGHFVFLTSKTGGEVLLLTISALSLEQKMIPDYPHKVFGDKRSCYCLLMEALAMDAVR